MSHTRKKIKTQSSLHSFLGIADYRVPKYFYLDWENLTTVFLKEPPLAVSWQEEFKWKAEKQDIIIGTSLQQSSPLPQETFYTQKCIPILKSHLQKCIRRQKSDLAIKTSFHLMKLDMISFLRRWSIIILEDSMLHIHYPIVIWLMCAVSKGFHPPDECISWLLGNVYATALNGFCIVTKEINVQNSTTLNSKFVFNLPIDFRNLIYALELRKAFGGMSCDTLMINEISSSMIDYYKKHSKIPKLFHYFIFEIEIIPWQSIENLKMDEWDLSAIDFHVSDILKKWSEIIHEPEESLKSIMWEASGSINKRSRLIISSNEWYTDSPAHCDKISFHYWNQHKSTVERLAKNILRQKLI